MYPFSSIIACYRIELRTILSSMVLGGSVFSISSMLQGGFLYRTIYLVSIKSYRRLELRTTGTEHSSFYSRLLFNFTSTPCLPCNIRRHG